jgi:cell division septum initiation protein DivIVA
LNVLQKKYNILAIENESLKAEVEIYRSEAATGQSSSSTNSASDEAATNSANHEMDHFIKSGDGTYAKSKSVELNNCHGPANVLCCSLSNDDSVLATGGADRNISLALWGNAFEQETTTEQVVESSLRVNCDAPVIAIDFSRKGHNTNFVAASCMVRKYLICV